MLERIVVPLDGSNTAEMVLPYVTGIASKSNSEVVLLRVSEPNTVMYQQYRIYLEGVADRMRADLVNWKAGERTGVETTIPMGRPVTEILRYVNERNCSLVAIASRGASNQEQWPLGETAQRILQGSSCPVLLIRKWAEAKLIEEKKVFNRIMLPLDGSRWGEAAITLVETLAGALESEIILFHSFRAGTPFERRETLSAYFEGVTRVLKENGSKVTNVIKEGPPAEAILDYAEANSIDLIAMSTHGRSGINRWVFGSVTEKVLNAGDTAVLVVRPG
jgi:nucleotide-binding universal stress UspA family protein